jgi:pescadillo
MLTFLEFYQTFVSFINYRLYTSVNLVYPPKLDIEKDDAGAGLAAYLVQSTTDTLPERAIAPAPSNPLPVKDTTKQLETLQSTLATLTTTIESTDKVPTPADDDNLDTFPTVDPETALAQPTSASTAGPSTLFKGLHVYLSRETPVDVLTFLLLSFSVSSLSTDPTCGPHPYAETDSRITHQICDRGKLPAEIVPGRKYVQPQWVVDTINRGELIGEGEYVPGGELPPHLSPFVEKGAGGYDPEEEMEVESEEEVEEQEEVDESEVQQRLLEQEAKGVPVETTSVKSVKKKKKAPVDEDKEAKEMAKIMMSNKKRRLLEAMEFGNKKRKTETEKLQSRKRELIREERKKKKVRLG